jgi:hypothetical protein
MSNDELERKVEDITTRMGQLEDENARLKAQLTRQSLSRKAYFEYRSEATFMGLPIVHIAQGFNPETGMKSVARGIIAIGDIAIGVFSMGGLSIGIFSLGGISLGLIATLGGVAIGGAALGGVAIGYFAIGGVAIGYLVSGGASIGHTPLNLSEILKYLFNVKF